MKNIKYHIVEMVPKSNRKTVERGIIDIPNTHINDRSLSWLGTDNSIKSGRVRVARTLIFCVVFCRSLFVLFLLANILSVLPYTDFDYHFCNWYLQTLLKLVSLTKTSPFSVVYKTWQVKSEDINKWVNHLKYVDYFSDWTQLKKLF